MDIGLAITQDGIHYHEPIRDFRLVPAREQPEAPAGVEPALVQGQGMENIGEQTRGVRLVTWQRDRIGMLNDSARLSINSRQLVEAVPPNISLGFER